MPFKSAEEKRAYDRDYYQQHKFSLTGETAAHFLLRSPTGKVLRVAKAGLSPTTFGRIRGFSGESGDPADAVVPGPDENGVPPEVETPDAGFATASFEPALAAPMPEPEAPAPAVGPIQLQGPTKPVPFGTKPNLQPPYAGPIQLHKPIDNGKAVGLTPVPDDYSERMNEVFPQGGPNYFTPGPNYSGDMAAQNPPVDLPGVSEDAKNDEDALRNYLTALRAQEMRDGQHIGIPGLPKYPEFDVDGFDEAKEAQRLLAVTKAATAKRSADIVDAFVQEKQALMAKHAEAMDQRQAASKKMQEDIDNSNIDPQHFWNSRTSGQKALAAFSMILGGASSAMTGQQNAALQILTQAAADDIDAQKANLGKKMSRLQMYLAETRDMREAQRLALADQYDIMASQLKSESYRAIGEQAPVEAAGAIAALTLQASQMRQQYELGKFNGELAKAKMRMDAALAEAQLGAKMQQRRVEKLKDMRGLKVLMPDDKTYRVANSVTDFKALQDSVSNYRTVKATLKRLQSLYKDDKTGIWNPLASKWDQALVYETDLAKALAKARERGNTSDKDFVVYEKMAGVLRGFKANPAQYGKHLEALGNILDDGVTAQIKQRSESVEQYLSEGF